MSATMTAAAIETMTFDHTALSVANIPAARKFYADVLGFTDIGSYHELDHLDIKIQIVMNPAGVRLELFEHKNSTAVRHGHPSEDARFRGWFQLGLRVENLQKTWDRVIAAGATACMPPCIAPDGKTKMAFITDPDNNLIEFIQRDA